jgi:hypothetical protein
MRKINLTDTTEDAPVMILESVVECVITQSQVKVCHKTESEDFDDALIQLNSSF